MDVKRSGSQPSGILLRQGYGLASEGRAVRLVDGNSTKRVTAFEQGFS